MSAEGHSPWAARAALLTAVCAVPLVLFGGSVTTLGAGMAVDGWLIAEGHFLLFFPVEKWFRDTPTFVEHTHRLFGVLVGLCAGVRARARDSARGQRGASPARWWRCSRCAPRGTLGGLRVLRTIPGSPSCTAPSRSSCSRCCARTPCCSRALA
jgi:cytochrome c oxidase assembly protein subunit 15